MLLHDLKKKWNETDCINKKSNSLSHLKRIRYHLFSLLSPICFHARALPCARPGGSFTVEAAFVFPLFLFAVLVILGFFPVLQLQVQVNHALQYAARMTAVSCQDPEEDHSAAAFVEGTAPVSQLSEKIWVDRGGAAGRNQQYFPAAVRLFRGLYPAGGQLPGAAADFFLEDRPASRGTVCADEKVDGGRSGGCRRRGRRVCVCDAHRERLSQHLRVFLSEAFHTVCFHSRSTGASESGRQHL